VQVKQSIIHSRPSWNVLFCDHNRRCVLPVHTCDTQAGDDVSRHAWVYTWVGLWALKTLQTP